VADPRNPQSLARYIQVYDDALDAGRCAAMVKSFHALERFQRRNGAGVRAGLESSGWTELDLTAFSDEGFRSALRGNMHAHFERYSRNLELTVPVPATDRTSEFIIKRYQPGAGDAFQPHFDALGPVSNRYLVFLWYLNDVEEGGETEFVDIGIRVAPRAGRLLVFPPYWMFQHAGRAPISNDKYILSTYFLFDP